VRVLVLLQQVAALLCEPVPVVLVQVYTVLLSPVQDSAVLVPVPGQSTVHVYCYSKFHISYYNAQCTKTVYLMLRVRCYKVIFFTNCEPQPSVLYCIIK